jgi:hypothetical protein
MKLRKLTAIEEGHCASILKKASALVIKDSSKNQLSLTYPITESNVCDPSVVVLEVDHRLRLGYKGWAKVSAKFSPSDKAIMVFMTRQKTSTTLTPLKP